MSKKKVSLIDDDFKQLKISGLKKVDFKALNIPGADTRSKKFSEIIDRTGKYDKSTKYSSMIYQEGESPESEEETESESPPDTPEDQETEVPPEPEIVMPDVEAIEREAYEKGFSEGFSKGETEGYETGMKKGEEAVESFKEVVTGCDNLWVDMVKKNEEQIIGLICKATEKIVAGKIEVDNEVIKHSIMQAFELIPEPEEVTIYVNPEDYDFIEIVKEDFFEIINGLKQLSIVSDPSVKRAGCRIETKSGEVNTNIEEKMEIILKTILMTGKI